MNQTSKPTRMQREAEKARKAKLRLARAELARRHPADRDEIRDGRWDQGAGMLGVLADMDATRR